MICFKGYKSILYPYGALFCPVAASSAVVSMNSTSSAAKVRSLALLFISIFRDLQVKCSVVADIS